MRLACKLRGVGLRPCRLRLGLAWLGALVESPSFPVGLVHPVHNQLWPHQVAPARPVTLSVRPGRLSVWRDFETPEVFLNAETFRAIELRGRNHVAPVDASFVCSCLFITEWITGRCLQFASISPGILKMQWPGR